MSYGGGAANERYEETTLIHEYGSYIFCFPTVDLNKVKIANEFRTLPASQNFKIERVKWRHQIKILYKWSLIFILNQKT